ncbi:MAG: glycosyltransferase family 39 protein [Acidobacteriaceae bacterium]
MLAMLPLLAFVLLVAGFRRKRAGWRESLLFASVPWALFLAFITEVLTQFRFLTHLGVALSWLAFALVCLVWMLKTRRASSSEVSPDVQVPPLHWMERVALGVTALILALTALTALVSAPNTWDAMMYHLPRVVEWMSNRGVQFYPTIDRFQLDQPSFAEYAMLHLYLLHGSDRLVALVQWFSYVGCILAASLIAKELGGTRRSQIVAAVFSATIPTAVLEASGTKTELVAAYWIALAVYLLLRWRRNQDWPHAVAIGATLGLAVFTKGTSYAFLPCIVLACGFTWNGRARKGFFLRLPLIAMVGILVCAPMWVRNYRYTGSPLGLPYFDGAGSVEGRTLRNTQVSPAAIVANMARNVALHAGMPSDRINAALTEVFSGFIRAIGVDPNDPRQLSATSFGTTPRFEVRFHPRYEVLAGDPLPLLLLLLAAVLFLRYRSKIGKEVGWLGLGLAGAFVLDSALLRWSEWNARYIIPILVLGAAITAVVLVRVLPRWVVNVSVVLVLLLALPLALMNETRPLITRHGLSGSVLPTPRDETYFFDFHREFAASFIAAAGAARGSSCRDIGIDANLLHYEYPMMAMLNPDGVARQIRYVGVENSSVRYVRPSESPVCMVICLGCLHAPKKIAEYSAKLPNVQSFGNVVLFRQPIQ